MEFFFYYSTNFKKKALLHFGLFVGGGGGYQTSASGIEPRTQLSFMEIVCMETNYQVSSTLPKTSCQVKSYL